MKRRVAALVLALLLAAAVPGFAYMTFSEWQYFNISGYGWCAVYDYNYTTGEWKIYYWYIGSGAPHDSWQVLRGAWRAFWVYDYQIGAWTDFASAYFYG